MAGGLRADIALSLENVRTRRRHERRMPLAAERNGRSDLRAGARANPLAPMRPPAPFVLRQPLEPRLGCCRTHGSRDEPRSLVARRIDQTLDVAAVREDERAPRPAIKTRGAVNPPPRRDVIGQSADDVRVDAYLAEIDLLPAHAELSGARKRIGFE